MPWWRVSQNNNANIIFNRKAFKAVTFRPDTLSPLLFNIVVDTLDIEMRKEKNLKMKTSLFSGHMITCTENPKETTGKF